MTEEEELSIPLNARIRAVIETIEDRNQLGTGIRMCQQRREDFSSKLVMQLTGIAMVPGARELMNNELTSIFQNDFSDRLRLDLSSREVLVGGGLQAAVYCASRVRRGFPKPVVLERSDAAHVGGAFAASLDNVFRLNSRTRPGLVGTPDQDKALNYLPGGLLQPSMITSEEYIGNGDMAFLIRLMLAQYAIVYPDTEVTTICPAEPYEANGRLNALRVTVKSGSAFSNVFPGRVLDARGIGTERAAGAANGTTMLTFTQLMKRMGGNFPLRNMKQVAVIGGDFSNGRGDSARCAIESMLGIAPGNSSPAELDYVQRVDWYVRNNSTPVNAATCSDYRNSQRGRYIRIAQFLPGNESQPTDRLRLIPARGYATPVSAQAVLVNDRTYDMAVLCTGSTLPDLNDEDNSLGYYSITADVNRGGTTLATQAAPYPSYRIGAAANIPFSESEVTSELSAIPANKVSMFRLVPRTAALAYMLGRL